MANLLKQRDTHRQIDRQTARQTDRETERDRENVSSLLCIDFFCTGGDWLF